MWKQHQGNIIYKQATWSDSASERLVDKVAKKILQTVVPEEDTVRPWNSSGPLNYKLHDVEELALPHGDVALVDVAPLEMGEPRLNWGGSLIGDENNKLDIGCCSLMILT